MIDDTECPKAGKHRGPEVAQIKKSEEAVQKAIDNFTNPWRIPDKNKLYSLASGAPVPPEVEVDVLRAELLGKSLKEQFIHQKPTQERV